MVKVRLHDDIKKVLKTWHMAVPVEYLIDTSDGDISITCVGDRGKPDAYLYRLPSNVILEGSGIVGKGGRHLFVLIRKGERMFAFLGREIILSLEWGGYYRFNDYFDYESYVENNYDEFYAPELLTK
jgi:hypothetical protein